MSLSSYTGSTWTKTLKPSILRNLFTGNVNGMTQLHPVTSDEGVNEDVQATVYHGRGTQTVQPMVKI